MTLGCDKKIIEGTCWLACFDLLGFRSKVYEYAQHHYADGTDGLSILAGKYIRKAISVIEGELANYRQTQQSEFYHVHFSDTFILYSADESRDSFWTIECAAQAFFIRMITEGVPLRGAVTCGRLYADMVQSIFVGPAMADAYYYAETQDWIGYVLTPAAVDRLYAMVPPIELPRLDYAEYEVPIKRKETVSGEKRPRFAFRISQCPFAHDRLCEIQREAKASLGEDYERCQSKYDNTWRFLDSTRLLNP